MDRIDSPDSSDPPPENGGHVSWSSSQDTNAPTRLDHMPREVGALVLITGMITGMLPPPPGPFDLSLVLAGGVALWPRGLRAIDVWARKRFPKVHRAGMSFLDRYLDDLERRYPGATNAVEYERAVLIQMLGDLARGDAGATRCADPPEESNDHTAARSAPSL
jgi:hypothetical protein